MYSTALGHTIVKVQKSLATTAGAKQMLIYSEPDAKTGKSAILYEGDLTTDVDAFLGDQSKRYAWAVMQGTKVRILAPAPDQTW